MHNYGRKLVLIAAAFTLCWAVTASAEKPLTPPSLDGAKVVTAARVKELLDSGAQLFDVRKKAEFAEAHIPGATHLYYKEKSAKAVDFDSSQDKFKVEKLPSNKAAKLVFQCNGPRCWKSYKASVLAVRSDYTDVNWFRGGIPAWKEAGYPVE